MTEPSAIQKVGRGMTGKSTSGLRWRTQGTWTVDEITLQKNHARLWGRVKIQRLIGQGIKPVVDAEKAPTFENAQPQPTDTTLETLESAVVNGYTDNLAVLNITHDPTLKTHLETVCMTHDAQIVTAMLSPGAQDFNPGVELSSFGLIIVDLEVLGDSEWIQKCLGCRLLRNWTQDDPSLPLLFIGTVSQKRAILAIRADTVGFLTRPIDWHEFASAVESFHRVKIRQLRPLLGVVDAPGSSVKRHCVS